MAKRFLNTELHNDPWYMELRPKYKSFWHHMLMTCNHSGMWQVNFKAASLFVNERLNEEECLEVFKDHIVPVDKGKFWFIPSFIYDQYGKILNPKSSVHKNVIENLKTYNLINKQTFLIEFTKGSTTLKDKAKAKVKEKVKAKVLNTPVNLKQKSNSKAKAAPKKKPVTKKTAPTPAPHSELHPLQVWINENAPQVASMEKPLTAAECTRLCAEFSEEKLKGKLLEMENYQILLTKYISANLTLRNWLKLEQERKAERNPGKKYTPPADTRTSFRYLQPGELSRKKTGLSAKPDGGMNAGIL